MSFFDSSYQVSYLSGGQLQIVAPPEYVSGLLFVIIALIPTIFFIYRIFKSRSLFPAWGILIFGTPFMIFSVPILQAGSLILDKEADVASFHEPYFLWHDNYNIKLSSIHYAEIRSMSASNYIAVVLDNGDAVGFAHSTQQGGKGRAAEAINRYIGSTVR